MDLALPSAWVVTCTACGCIVTCQAIDPQERVDPSKPEPSAPREARVVTCSCCWQSYLYRVLDIFKGVPKPSDRCAARRSASPRGSSETQSQNGSRPDAKADGALLITASIIAAVRLNKEEIKNTPRVHARIADSIQLAQMILSRLRSA